MEERFALIVELHNTFRGVEHWTCLDRNSYDGDHRDVGAGPSKWAAVQDWLERQRAFEEA